jgi:hypothetical protein
MESTNPRDPRIRIGGSGGALTALCPIPGTSIPGTPRATGSDGTRFAMLGQRNQTAGSIDTGAGMMQCSWIRAAGLVLLASALSGASGATAQTKEPVGDSPPAVSLDALLTLPESLPVETGRRGGASRTEWRDRFAAAEAQLQESQAALDEAMGRLEDLASKSSAWKVAAPGAPRHGDDNSPMDYGLRQDIRRKREDVERSERALRELSVEANLAGVPEDWQRSQ